MRTWVPGPVPVPARPTAHRCFAQSSRGRVRAPAAPVSSHDPRPLGGSETAGRRSVSAGGCLRYLRFPPFGP